MIFKKLHWTLKRHPFLYLTRFRLLSKNCTINDIAEHTYNSNNPKEEISKVFYDTNRLIFKHEKPKTNFEMVRQLCIWLNEHIKGGPGLSEPSARALTIMLEGKGGVCSDVVQVFNNFCVINDLQVREWGSINAPFNRDNGGHSFNEVYMRELQKWVLIDPFFGGYFCNENQDPLSVIEMYQLRRANVPILYQSLLAENNIKQERIDKSYFNSDIVPFLIYNYRNKVYDWYLKWTRPYIPVFIIHFVVFMTGKSYHYKFPLDDYKKIFS